MDNLQCLQNGKKNKNLLAIYRDDLADVMDFSGFPVVVGNELVILAKEHDFFVDGFVAMRISDITYLEQVDDNGFVSKILKGENIYNQISPPKLTDGNNWHQLLSGVQASFGGWLTAESISDDGQCFFLGSICRLDSNSLYLKPVDALGKQSSEEVTIPLQDLVTVAFGSRYIKIYQKYTRK